MSHPRNEKPSSTWTILVLSSLKESPLGASHAAPVASPRGRRWATREARQAVFISRRTRCEYVEACVVLGNTLRPTASPRASSAASEVAWRTLPTRSSFKVIRDAMECHADSTEVDG